jgi:plasmid stabilization system protein ParE
MNLTILDQAKQDLVDGFRFYEIQGVGVGDYFLDSAYAEIDSLVIHAGIHRVVAGFHRLLVRRFPFAIYYRLEADTVMVWAVVDCRRKPSFIKSKLTLKRRRGT